MNSIGYGVSDNKIKELLESGLGAWNISLDSISPSINDKLRGKKRTFENINNLINRINMIKYSNPNYSRFHINIMTVITKYNFLQIPDLIKYAISKKISSIYFMYVYGDNKLRQFLLNKEEINIFRSVVVPKTLKVMEENVASEIVNINAVNVLSELYPKDNPDTNYECGIYWTDFDTIKKKCQTPYYYALIEPTGIVLPCCLVEIAQEGIVGNIFNNSFKEIWNGKEYNAFRNKRIDFCLQCPSLRHKTLGLVPEMCRQFI
jgi:MoaA/NifB/PqqE/SkfB family radical SAM enzyme